jgi:hypothetical protein
MFWNLLLRRLFSTFGSSAWQVGRAAEILDVVQRRPTFVCANLDRYSLSIVRNCLPPAHNLRQQAEQTLAQNRESSADRAELELRCASFAEFEQRQLWGRWQLNNALASLEAVERAMMPRAITFLTRILLQDMRSQVDLAQNGLGYVLGWIEAVPEEPTPIGCFLFRQLRERIPALPMTLPDRLPPWWSALSAEEADFLARSLNLGEEERLCLALSFYAGLNFEQICAVMGEAVDNLEENYLSVLQ